MRLPDTSFEADDSGKLGALREIVDEAVDGGHRVLVFSQFVTMLNHIRAALDEDGVQYEYLCWGMHEVAVKILAIDSRT